MSASFSAGLPVASDPLVRLRIRGVQVWALIGWLSFAALLIANAVLGSGVAAVLVTSALATNAVPTAMAWQRRHDVAARIVMGSLAAVVPAMLVFVLQGHAWQMDAHMYFFVAMAALVVLADWRPIALATVLVATHHLALEWFAPTWVFEGNGNLGRVLFHIVAVGLLCGTLTLLTRQLARLIAGQQQLLDRARDATELAEQRLKDAEEAMAQARAAEAETGRERREREALSIRLAQERRGELVTLANQFEGSVASIVKRIAQLAERLDSSTLSLERSTADASREAEQVAADAAGAAGDIGRVASSIRDLSQSVRTIAVAVDRQSVLTQSASSEAKRSVQTAAMLEEHAVQIEGFLDDIRQIATKTNLLALNATIEAARAGDAGRGFAVVAGEVKSLSADTTRASDRIGTLLSGIREGVADTGAKLRSVNEAIGEVSSAADGIAAAVGEQRSTAQSVDASAARAADAARAIETGIDGVVGAAGAASSLADAVRGSVGELTAGATALRESTDLFVSFLHSDVVLAA